MSSPGETSSRATVAPGDSDSSEPHARKRVLVRRRVRNGGGGGQQGRWLVGAARRGYFRMFLVSAGVFVLMAIALYFALRQA